ncbi:hypothetical protein CDAR_319051 [Caerostris darwini]|uniref:Uncharacterized protein n=1 Tax=Caerostris darwini TaxID=1538125 RepID=A0AAV4TYL5_9ARAC|nr:hypothetical protein CDAR_319051 [Caerostris darwini]
MLSRLPPNGLRSVTPPNETLRNELTIARVIGTSRGLVENESHDRSIAKEEHRPVSIERFYGKKDYRISIPNYLPDIWDFLLLELSKTNYKKLLFVTSIELLGSQPKSVSVSLNRISDSS